MAIEASDRLVLRTQAEALIDRMTVEHLKVVIPVMEFFVRSGDHEEIRRSLDQVRESGYGELYLKVVAGELAETEIRLKRRRGRAS